MLVLVVSMFATGEFPVTNELFFGLMALFSGAAQDAAQAAVEMQEEVTRYNLERQARNDSDPGARGDHL